MLVLSNSPGRVVKIKDDVKICRINILDMKGDDIVFEKHESIITRISVTEEVNKQLVHTVGNKTYLYVFGDRVGNLTIDGVAFAPLCPCDEKNAANLSPGFERILQWYNTNKASQRASPLTIVLGSNTVLNGFLVNFSLRVVDVPLRMFEWSMLLHTVPPKPPLPVAPAPRPVTPPPVAPPPRPVVPLPVAPPPRPVTTP